MPEPITANYVAEMQGTGKHPSLCVTSTLEGDIVATVYDIEETLSVYMSYEVASIEQAKKKAEEAACQYLLCRVTGLGPSFMGKTQVAVELIMPTPGFWSSGSSSKTPNIG